MGKERDSSKQSIALNLAAYKRHIVFCAGPDCCQNDQGDELWHYLKSRLKERGLVNAGSGVVFRTKAHCLRVCCDGPIAVVYPEGTWYRRLDKKALDLIIDEHLIHGREVEANVLTKNHAIGR